MLKEYISNEDFFELAKRLWLQDIIMDKMDELIDQNNDLDFLSIYEEYDNILLELDQNILQKIQDAERKAKISFTFFRNTADSQLYRHVLINDIISMCDYRNKLEIAIFQKYDRIKRKYIEGRC